MDFSGGGGGTRKVAVPVLVTPEPATALLLGLGARGVQTTGALVIVPEPATVE